MKTVTRLMPAIKRIALVAHDNCKPELLQWIQDNQTRLSRHELCATGTTGALINQMTNLQIERMISGPMGGDQQIGARISRGDIDILIFFWDPLNAVPHDPDVKALLRIASVWNIPVATNRACAEFLLASPLFDQEVALEIPDYQDYLQRRT
ncbi:methylglyoxal synthase [Vibrio ponticus]|uniref:Methylglyoxal synthase n=1 Tax=Vibrio ponticus TaxID=265668 RepID=A0ABX3FA36_9VIBR|nr:methylglyoxal synthase [Vibrio ponticus]OLQ87853.1 methylglyoxal synthase [Vibrio ponticus]